MTRWNNQDGADLARSQANVEDQALTMLSDWEKLVSPEAISGEQLDNVIEALRDLKERVSLFRILEGLPI